MRTLFFLGAFGLGAAYAPPALAQPKDAAALAPPDAPAVSIVVRVDDGLDPDRIRAAVSRELGRGAVIIPNVAEGQEDVLFVTSVSPGRVLVTYRAPGGLRNERILDIPASPDAGVEAIALLAGNLARNEAGELAALLTPKPSADLPRAPSPPKEAAPRCRLDPDTGPRFGLDFLPHIGISSLVGSQAERVLSLNILAGASRGLSGVEVGGLVNLEGEFVCGAQLAGIANISGGPQSGAQVAGLMNLTHGTSEGVQVAGLLNRGGDLRGLRFGGLFNFGAELRGAAVAGIANRDRDVHGLQAAGVMNLASRVEGAQVGVVNIASGDVRGVQVGVINIAEDSDVSIGLISFVRNGRYHADAWATESGLAVVAFKHGGRRFHNLYGLGMHVSDGRFAPMVGVGFHQPLSRGTWADLDVLYHVIVSNHSGTPPIHLTQTRLSLGIRLVDGLSVFAGPTANTAVYPAGYPEKDLSPYGSLSAGASTRVWLGVSAGIEAF